MALLSFPLLQAVPLATENFGNGNTRDASDGYRNLPKISHMHKALQIIHELHKSSASDRACRKTVHSLNLLHHEQRSIRFISFKCEVRFRGCPGGGGGDVY